MLKKELFILSFVFLCFLGTVKAQQTKSINVFFNTDVSRLNQNEIKNLNAFLKGMDTVNIVSISIFGYCDDVGRKGYNDTLSTMRADFIKDMLLSANVKDEVINILEGKGKLPLSKESSVIEQRNFNRRAEIIVSYTSKSKEKGILSDKQKVGDKIVLENILFEVSRHQLLPESYPTLIKLIKVLKEQPEYHIAILGHVCCNPPGKDIRDFDTGENNLSLARAKVIYEFLIQNGIAAERLSYKGMMANFPLGKGDKNDRRVEVQITSIESKVKP